MRPGDSLLAIYLNDHLGASTGGLELARRALRSNPDRELGRFLTRLVHEIEEDRTELRSIMWALGVKDDRVKLAAGWLGERAGRLKLNGRLRGYSPLSRVLELEALIAGVEAKLALWRALRALAPGEPRLDTAQLDRLATRGERQLEELRARHGTAAPEALSA
ncbi:MAG: hypothetical protein ACM3UV_07995 [Nocardioidaceae bacterium]